MILYGEYRKILVRNTFDCFVIQVAMSDSQRRRAGNFIPIPDDREAVILRGDFHGFGVQISYRVISAAVSIRELPGAAPERAGDQLAPQTDSENR